MQKAYEEDKLAAEEKQNFAKERDMEKSRKQKEMLALLKERKEGKEQKAEKEVEKETGGGIAFSPVVGYFANFATSARERLDMG